LILDEEYVVLEIHVEPGQGAAFRIIPKDGTPALFEAAMFMTTDQGIPDTWEARVREGGIVHIAPTAWLQSGFWERFFDRDPEAVAVFVKELEHMGT